MNSNILTSYNKNVNDFISNFVNKNNNNNLFNKIKNPNDNHKKIYFNTYILPIIYLIQSFYYEKYLSKKNNILNNSSIINDISFYHKFYFNNQLPIVKYLNINIYKKYFSNNKNNSKNLLNQQINNNEFKQIIAFLSDIINFINIFNKPFNNQNKIQEIINEYNNITQSTKFNNIKSIKKSLIDKINSGNININKLFNAYINKKKINIQTGGTREQRNKNNKKLKQNKNNLNDFFTKLHLKDLNDIDIQRFTQNNINEIDNHIKSEYTKKQIQKFKDEPKYLIHHLIHHLHNISYNLIMECDSLINILQELKRYHNYYINKKSSTSASTPASTSAPASASTSAPASASTHANKQEIIKIITERDKIIVNFKKKVDILNRNINDFSKLLKKIKKFDNNIEYFKSILIIIDDYIHKVLLNNNDIHDFILNTSKYLKSISENLNENIENLINKPNLKKLLDIYDNPYFNNLINEFYNKIVEEYNAKYKELDNTLEILNTSTVPEIKQVNNVIEKQKKSIQEIEKSINIKKINIENLNKEPKIIELIKLYLDDNCLENEKNEILKIINNNKTNIEKITNINKIINDAKYLQNKYNKYKNQIKTQTGGNQFFIIETEDIQLIIDKINEYIEKKNNNLIKENEQKYSNIIDLINNLINNKIMYEVNSIKICNVKENDNKYIIIYKKYIINILNLTLDNLRNLLNGDKSNININKLKTKKIEFNNEFNILLKNQQTLDSYNLENNYKNYINKYENLIIECKNDISDNKKEEVEINKEINELDKEINNIHNSKYNKNINSIQRNIELKKIKKARATKEEEKSIINNNISRLDQERTEKDAKKKLISDRKKDLEKKLQEKIEYKRSINKENKNLEEKIKSYEKIKNNYTTELSKIKDNFDLSKIKNSFQDYIKLNIEKNRFIIDIQNRLNKYKKHNIFLDYFDNDDDLRNIIKIIIPSNTSSTPNPTNNTQKLFKNINKYVENLESKNQNLENKLYFKRINKDLNDFKLDTDSLQFIKDINTKHIKLVKEIKDLLKELSNKKINNTNYDKLNKSEQINKIKNNYLSINSNLKSNNSKKNNKNKLSNKIYVYSYIDTIKMYFIILNLIKLYVNNC